MFDEKSWEMKPLALETVSSKVQNILAVDESGTTCKCNVAEDWLSLTGIIININDFSDTEEKVMKLKNKYWKDALFYSKRVVLHSRDIQKKQRAFSKIVIQNFVEFEKDLQDMINSVEMKVIASNIDKNSLYDSYFNPYDTYELAVEFMIERYVLYLEQKNENGIIIFESRGRKEDNRILLLIMNLINNGNNYIKNYRFGNRILGVYFNRKQTKDFSKSYWALELADICSDAIYKTMKKQDTELFKLIQNKVIGYPDYNGKGMKVFPK